MKILLALILLAGTAGAQTLTLDDGFALPSGRLHCQFDAQGQQGPTVRCDVLEPTFKRTVPASCPLDYGDSLALDIRGKALFVCHGDTVFDPSRPVLAYDQLWQRGGLTCLSSKSGVRCINIDGHGFELSRTRASTF